MVFLKIKIYLLPLFLITSGFAKAIVSEAIIADRAGNTIVFIKDRHIDQKTNKKGPVQKDNILDHCVAINQRANNNEEKVLLITEDNHFYDGSNEHVKKFINKASAYLEEKSKHETRAACMHTLEDEEIVTDSILANITRESLNLNIDCFNVECRQAGYASENDDSVTGKDIVIEFERTTKEISDDLEHIKTEASHNQDAQIIYDECTKIMDNGYQSIQGLIEFLRNSPLSLRQLLAQGELEDNDNLLQIYDRYLIDVRILLGWYKNRNRKTIIIAAGFSHLERILPTFELLGHSFSTYGKKYIDRVEMVKNCLDIDAFFLQLHNRNQQSIFKVVSQKFVPSNEPLIGNVFMIAADSLFHWLA